MREPDLIGPVVAAMSSRPRGGLPAEDRKEGPALARLDGPTRLPLCDAAGRVDTAALCARATDALEGSPPRRLECDASDVPTPDLGVVEALARLELTVRRGGGSMRIIGASEELLDLLAFCGLRFGLALEAERQSEHRVEAGRVEEERDPGDPIA
jgi:hypothetical protein